jgi:hypothetical protein
MAARSQQSAIPTSEWQQIIVTSVAPEVGLEGVYTDLVKWERITLDHKLMTDSGEKIGLSFPHGSRNRRTHTSTQKAFYSTDINGGSDRALHNRREIRWIAGLGNGGERPSRKSWSQ